MLGRIAILFFIIFTNKLPEHVCVQSKIFALETILDITKSLLLLLLYTLLYFTF
jgi:hypothetical protein